MTASKLLVCTLAMVVTTCSAQTPPQTLPQGLQQPSPPPAEPGMTQIRKSVTFIKLLCREGSQEFDVRGTGFFVFYPDSRLGKDQGFVYLVTNRHVALCWNDSGQPMQVESISVRLNRRQAVDDKFSQDGFLNEHGNVPWVTPQDDSIDLAALPFLPDLSRFDFKTVPLSLFATSDVLSQRNITEGEPVFFAGFFYQFPGTNRMLPIVRQGIIAMMPEEKIPFVVSPMKLYLADLHAFGGNSGSPAFINLGGMHGGAIYAGEDYRLLGVVNGDISEDEHLNLQLTTTVTGTARANSGVSTIVPADELKALLDDPRLQQRRDDVVKAREGAPK